MICLNLKVTENVLIVSARCGLLSGIGCSFGISRLQRMFCKLMLGVVFLLGLSDQFESQGHRECFVNYCQVLSFG